MTIIFLMGYWTHVLCIFLLIVYSFAQLRLLVSYVTRPSVRTAPEYVLSEPPFITIQLPIYNELYVIDRLLDNVVRCNYPKHRFEVQVLNDSTDETSALINRKVAQLVDSGFDITHIQRSGRTGYKAGALKHGLRSARGEYIAIFDADFLPRPDFFSKTLPWFADAKTGVVQTRWEHLIETYSVLTRIQALMLNAHFRVEQQGRQSAGYLRQFNGTAGIWRRSAIEDAGGWQTDTLTEDLDLSFRAQLRGWQVTYLEEVTCPGELPIEMNGIKSQQFRWMKGIAETARKTIKPVWCSQLTLLQKVDASFYLFSSSVFPVIFLFGLSSVPASLLPNKSATGLDISKIGILSLIPFIATQYVANVYASSRKGDRRRPLIGFIVLCPLFLSLSMGLAFHNSVAVLQGWCGRKTPFIRTPKFNIMRSADTIQTQRYLAARLSWVTIFEAIIAIYFLTAIIHNVMSGLFSAIPLQFMSLVGYATIFIYSCVHLAARPVASEGALKSASS